MREQAGLSLENPLDLAVIDDFIARMPGDVHTAAILLAADRRGKSMADLGRALVTNLASSAPRKFAGDDDRIAFLGDLAESADRWGFAEGFSDRAIAAAFGGCTELNDGDFGEEAVMMLLDSVGSLGREGYNLHWLAGRIGRIAGVPWQDVVSEANVITSSEARAAREALLQ